MTAWLDPHELSLSDLRQSVARVGVVATCGCAGRERFGYISPRFHDFRPNSVQAHPGAGAHDAGGAAGYNLGRSLRGPHSSLGTSYVD